jgi:hypothetical protein
MKNDWTKPTQSGKISLRNYNNKSSKLMEERLWQILNRKSNEIVRTKNDET